MNTTDLSLDFTETDLTSDLWLVCLQTSEGLYVIESHLSDPTDEIDDPNMLVVYLPAQP